MLLFPVVVVAQLPPPNHPITFGYYYVDKPTYGDYRSRTFCYTDSYYLLVKTGAQANETDPVGVWFPIMQQQIADAVAAGKNVHVNLDLPDPDFMTIDDFNNVKFTPLFGQVLDALAPYWNSVVRVELADEPSWRSDQIDAIAGAVNLAFDLRGMARKPLGVVQGAGGFADPIASTQLAWIGIEAYMCAPDAPASCPGVRGDADPAINLANLNEFLTRIKGRVEGSNKDVVLVMQAYTRGGTWDAWISNLVDMQTATYLQAYNDWRVVGINMFAYGRTGEGTVAHPELQNAHKDIARALYGSINCGDTPPAAPGNLKAAINSFGFQVTLTWNGGDGNIGIERSANGGGWGQIASLAPGSTSYVDNTPALPSGASANYSYRVFAYNSSGSSPFSNTATITLYGSVPDVPVLIGPKDCITTLRPQFSWNSAARATNYYIAVTRADIENFFVNQPGVPGTTYDLSSDLLVSVQYRWKVKACNNVGCGGWAPSMFFKTFCSGVGTTITAPLGCIATQTPTFTWLPVSGAVDYWLLVAASPDFSANPWLVNVTLPPSTTSYAPGYVFSPNTTYYAKIKTHVAAGSTAGGWSATIAFTPLCPDSAPH